MTHKTSLGTEATCWQFRRGTSIPVWVARKFHRLGADDKWTATDRDGKLVEANEGDWAVSDGKTALVLTQTEFSRIFRPIAL